MPVTIPQARPIRSEASDHYLEQRVIASGNPRRLGKPLRGDRGEFWSYRVGHYRIVTVLEDEKLVVVIVSVGHRRDIYR